MYNLAVLSGDGNGGDDNAYFFGYIGVASALVFASILHIYIIILEK